MAFVERLANSTGQLRWSTAIHATADKLSPYEDARHVYSTSSNRYQRLGLGNRGGSPPPSFGAGLTRMLRRRMRSAPWGQGVKVRLLVIIDEAHVGIPEDGSHMRAVEARYGAEHTQVPFTATPKVENLLAHGLSLPDNRRGRQHHTEPHRSNAMGTLLAPSPPAIPQGPGDANAPTRNCAANLGQSKPSDARGLALG